MTDRQVDLDALDALYEKAVHATMVLLDAGLGTHSDARELCDVALESAWPSVSAELRAARAVVEAVSEWYEVGQSGDWGRAISQHDRLIANIYAALNAYRTATGPTEQKERHGK